MSTQTTQDFYEMLNIGVFSNIARRLTLLDRSRLSRTAVKMNNISKQFYTVYRIGMTNGEGKYKWDTDTEYVSGWGMIITVHSSSEVEGLCKNDGRCAVIAQEKIITGNKVGNTLNLLVEFKNTHQVNTYIGTINDNYFTGTFKLIQSFGSRPVGSGGIIEGKVTIY